MKKIIAAAIFIMIAGSAYSTELVLDSFMYQCSSTDENTPSEITIETNGMDEPLMFLVDPVQVIVEEYYIDGSYKPASGSPMYGFLKLDPKDPNLAYGPGNGTPFYAEKSLMTGGKELGNGIMGGLMKTAKPGKPWTVYLCVRNKPVQIEVQ